MTPDDMTDKSLDEPVKRSTNRCPTHPGALLRDIVLPALERSKSQIAKDLGISRQTLHDILAERQPVTPQMAVRLSVYLGNAASFWLRMQTAHDLWKAEREVNTANIPRLSNAAA
jgi:antitoxin HigA-1